MRKEHIKVYFPAITSATLRDRQGKIARSSKKQVQFPYLFSLADSNSAQVREPCVPDNARLPLRPEADIDATCGPAMVRAIFSDCLEVMLSALQAFTATPRGARSFFSMLQPKMITPDQALAGRASKMPVATEHYVLAGNQMEGPWPAGMQVCIFANGCFWGSEKGIWRLPGDGIYSTAVGYAAGFTPNPSYEECCSGRTGSTEAVQVVFDPAKISFVDILRWFWCAASYNLAAGCSSSAHHLVCCSSAAPLLLLCLTISLLLLLSRGQPCPHPLRWLLSGRRTTRRLVWRRVTMSAHSIEAASTG